MYGYKISECNHKFVESSGFYVCIYCGYCLQDKVFSNQVPFFDSLVSLAKKNRYEYRTARYYKSDYKNRTAIAYYRTILKELGFSDLFIDYIYKQWLKLRKYSNRTHPKAILVFAYMNATTEAQRKAVIDYYNKTYNFKNKYQFYVYKHKVLKQFGRCM